MPYQFFIDNRFLFTTENNSIKDITNGNFITLITPASRCLTTLLMNRRLVTHEELYSSGWGNMSKDPAPSSLYQNILLIRKAFKTLSNSETDYITTVPRKGFIFKTDAKISLSENAWDMPPKPDQKNENAVTPPCHLFDTEFTPFNVPDKKTILIYINYFLIMSSVLLLITVLIKTLPQPTENIFSENFRPYIEANGCKYFIEKKATISLLENIIKKPAVQKTWNTISDESGVSCETHPWRYVIVFEHEVRDRVIACSRPGDHAFGQKCITIFRRNS